MASISHKSKQLDKLRAKVEMLQGCIFNLSYLLENWIPRKNKEARRLFTDLNKKLYAELEGLSNELKFLKSPDRLNIEEVCKRLREAIEGELVFFFTEKGFLLPDKVREAEDLGKYANPEIAVEFCANLEARVVDVRRWEKEIRDQYSKDLCIIFLDLMKSNAPKTSNEVIKRARETALKTAKDFNGRHNPSVRKDGTDEFYLIFDEAGNAVCAGIKIQQLVNPSIMYRMGIDWGPKEIEKEGRVLEKSPGIAGAKRIMNLNPSYRQRGLIYCSSELRSKIADNSEISKVTGIDIVSALVRHQGPFPLKEHENPLPEIWEILWNNGLEPVPPAPHTDARHDLPTL